MKYLIFLMPFIVWTLPALAAGEFGLRSSYGTPTYTLAGDAETSSFQFDTTFKPQLQSGPGINLRFGNDASGLTLLQEPMTNFMVVHHVYKNKQLSQTLGGAALGQSTLDPSQFRRNARAFCGHVAAGKGMAQRPDGCDREGSTASSMCDLASVMSGETLGRVQRVLAANPSRSVDACIDELERAREGVLVADPAISTDAISATYVTENRKDEQGPVAEIGGCPEATDGAKTAQACDDFDRTALGSSDTSALISSFITDYKGFGDWGISRLFGFTSKVACERCFERRYRAQEGLAGGAGDDFKPRYQQELKARLIELRARKAEEALSEYLKFQERNLFMSEFLSAQPERCNSAQTLRQLPKFCKTDKASEVLALLAKRHGVSFDGRDVGAFVDRLQQRLRGEMVKPMPTMGCQGRTITHQYYLQSSQAHVASGTMAPDTLLTPDAKRDIAACAEHDQRCFLRALVKVRASQLRGDVTEAEKEVRNFFRQPFYRTLIAHRSNLLDYASTERISGENPYDAYVEKNRDLLAAAASRDASFSCNAFDKDFVDALCVSDGDLADHYSGEGIRQELTDLLAANPDVSGPEKVLAMAVACNIMSSAGDMKTEVHQSKAHFDNVIDRRELSDVFLRGNVRRAPLDSAKGQAFIAKFSLEVCDKATFQQIHEIAAAPADSTEEPYAPSLDIMDFSSTIKATPDSYLPRNYSTPAPTSTLSAPAAVSSESFQGVFSSSRRVTVAEETYPGQSYLDYNDFNPFKLNFTAGPEIPSSTELAGLDVARASQTVESASDAGDTLVEVSKKVAMVNDVAVQTTVDVSPSESTADVSLSASFASGIGQSYAAAPVAGAAVYPIDPGIRLDGRSDATAGATGEEIVSYRRGSLRERYVQQVETQLVQDEQAVLAQARDQQTLQDLKNQAQIEQLRLELQRIQLSNQQLLASVKRLSQPSQENVFDAPEPAALEERIAEDDERERPAPVRTGSRAPASVSPKPESAAAVARTASESSPRTPSVQSAGAANLPRSRAGEEVSAASGGASAPAASASVAVSRGGTQASSGRSAPAALTASVFRPSSGLQTTISATPSVDALPQEKRVELLKEFLSYVEKNPDYREGRYLHPENAQVEIDYEGRTVVLKVQDIQDPQLRTQLQERLLRQRVVLNQYARATRLQTLRRLLASTRVQGP